MLDSPENGIPLLGETTLSSFISWQIYGRVSFMTNTYFLLGMNNKNTNLFCYVYQKNLSVRV